MITFIKMSSGSAEYRQSGNYSATKSCIHTNVKPNDPRSHTHLISRKINMILGLNEYTEEKFVAILNGQK